jgi:rod shape-determining protein MreC
VQDTRRTRLVLGALLITALAMITVSYRDGSSSPLSALSSLGASVFGPLERLTGVVTRPAAQLVDGVKGASSASAKISALQRENARLRAELSAAQLGNAEESQLRRLLSLAGRGGYRVVAANVIAAGPGYENTVTLDAGSLDGIRPDQTVLNGAGLVGRVVSVTSGTSTVLLATDASSIVGARMAGTGEIGAVTGTGKGLAGPQLLRLELFNANAVLQVGQQLVTFGSVGGRPYVPGVPIGTISQLQGGGSLTKAALVRPFVDFTALGVVGVVIAPPRTNPRDSVLPPQPQPTATGSAATNSGKPGQSVTSRPASTPGKAR